MSEKQDQGLYDLSQWQSFQDFLKANPNFTSTQIEWMHRKRYSNGFAKSFRKFGKRRYIHAGIFAQCLLEQAD